MNKPLKVIIFVRFYDVALFSNVEHNLLDKVRSILENTDVDVNSLNSDGLSALDIAVLMKNRQMAKLLLQNGALPGPQSSDNLGNYLNSLIFDAEQKLHHLGGISETAAAHAYNTRASFSSIIGSTSQSCTGTETERQMGVWEKRIRGLRRLITGWQMIQIPDPPISFTIGIYNAFLIFILRNYGKPFSHLFNPLRCDWNQLSYAENT